MTSPAAPIMVRRSWRRAMIASPEAPLDVVDDLWRDPHGLIGRAEIIKPGDRTIISVVVSAAGEALILKRANLKHPLHTLLHLPLRSRAAWSWRNAARLGSAGIRTPQPLATLEERLGSLRLQSYLLTRMVHGLPLSRWMEARSANDPASIAIADQFATIWRRLGNARLAHRDMKATNFIVDDDLRIWLVDLDSMRRLPRGPLLSRARRRDRARFLRNWQDRREVQGLFRARIDTAGPHGG